jgi:hypothetical protein
LTLIIAFERQIEDVCSPARKAKKALFENKAAFAWRRRGQKDSLVRQNELLEEPLRLIILISPQINEK